MVDLKYILLSIIAAAMIIVAIFGFSLIMKIILIILGILAILLILKFL